MEQEFNHTHWISVRNHHSILLRQARQDANAASEKIYELDSQMEEHLRNYADFLREHLPGWDVHTELNICQAHLHMTAPFSSRYIDYDFKRNVWLLTDERADWKDVCLELTWDELKAGILEGAPFYSAPPHKRIRR